MSRPNLYPPTAEDTVGPYYPLAFCDLDSADLERAHRGIVARAEGPPIVLTGRVLDVAGQPVSPLLIEFSQADANGRRLTPDTLDEVALDPHFTGYARQYVEDGWYRLSTVRPGAIAASADEAARAPHVTITIFCDGLSRVVTQIFFADAPENAADPLLAALPAELRPRLVAERAGEVEGATVYVRDIVLRGDGETPFFDDLES